MKYFVSYLLLLLLSISSTTLIEKNTKADLLASNNLVEPVTFSAVSSLYKDIESRNTSVPKLESFSQALAGFYDLKAKGIVSKNILTIIDFSLSSTTKRMWIIDMTTHTVLLHSLVSHGMKSGLEYANDFSNAENSHKSSLGFYATGESYIGKHGLSLRLDGLEKGTNNNARARGVVIHGAAYSNPLFLQSQAYLGRSQGCPAVPEKLSNTIIQMIKDKSCLFIYHPSRDIHMFSKYI